MLPLKGTIPTYTNVKSDVDRSCGGMRPTGVPRRVRWTVSRGPETKYNFVQFEQNSFVPATRNVFLNERTQEILKQFRILCCSDVYYGHERFNMGHHKNIVLNVLTARYHSSDAIERN